MKNDEKANARPNQISLPYYQGEALREWLRTREEQYRGLQAEPREAGLHNGTVGVVIMQTGFLGAEHESEVRLDALSKLRANLPQKRTSVQESLKQNVVSDEV